MLKVALAITLPWKEKNITGAFRMRRVKNWKYVVEVEYEY